MLYMLPGDVEKGSRCFWKIPVILREIHAHQYCNLLCVEPSSDSGVLQHMHTIKCTSSELIKGLLTKLTASWLFWTPWLLCTLSVSHLLCVILSLSHSISTFNVLSSLALLWLSFGCIHHSVFPHCSLFLSFAFPPSLPLYCSCPPSPSSERTYRDSDSNEIVFSDPCPFCPNTSKPIEPLFMSAASIYLFSRGMLWKSLLCPHTNITHTSSGTHNKHTHPSSWVSDRHCNG